LIEKTVFVLAVVGFINRQRKGKQEYNDDELNPIGCGLEKSRARNPASEVAHSGGPASAQQQAHDHNGVNEVEEEQPISAFEIGIGASALGGRNFGEVGVYGGLYFCFARVCLRR